MFRFRPILSNRLMGLTTNSSVSLAPATASSASANLPYMKNISRYLSAFKNSYELRSKMLVTTFSRHLTITEMEEILHQTKLYLVELEDNPSTAEKLQYHQQFIDQVTRSLRSVEQNHQDLIVKIADLENNLQKEISKRMQLANDVQNLKETVAQQNTRITALTTRVDEATNKDNTVILRQIATSFQHKAAKYCGVGKKGRQFCVTYDI
jgi:septal ring factor EnvC (AmiA/AmiB activator)